MHLSSGKRWKVKYFVFDQVDQVDGEDRKKLVIFDCNIYNMLYDH